MRTFRFRTLSAMALAALTATTTLVARAAEVTDNFPGVWRVTVTPDGNSQQAGKQEFSDEVLFEDSKLLAAACASYGFAPSQYVVSNNGMTFSSTMTANGESIVWSANQSGGRMSGVVVWTKANGDVYHYTLTGARLVDSGGEDASE